MGYSLRDFDISVPDHLIAQYPSNEREKSRLLILDVEAETIEDDYFYNLKKYILPGECLVFNDARVIHARLFGRKCSSTTGDDKASAGPSGSGAVLEILLLRRLNKTEWRCLIKPARRVRRQTEVELISGDRLAVVAIHGEGLFTIRFCKPVEYEDLMSIGEIPLPAYIKRKSRKSIDDERYQTVYSNRLGAVAAPTAGLHFTESIIEDLQNRGVITVSITLNIDWGTFQPVREEDYRNHRIHSELFEISESSAEQINSCRREGKRIICVGTTSVRALETATGKNGMVAACRGETDLYIYPGYKFKNVDAMITNFHMPDSTLILLVAAFSGKNSIERAYNHAVSHGYRFFSYGDAMFIQRSSGLIPGIP
jgi:S-adenosylmethionine:tRNA ribosyltransferase-isomerase